MKVKAAIYSLMAVILAEILLAFTLSLFPVLLVGASVNKIINFLPFYLSWVAGVAAIIVVFIGAPIFFFLVKRKIASTRNIAVIGFFVPIIILVLFSLIFSLGDGFSSGANYYGTYRDMVIDGERTFWGWLSFGEGLLKFGVHGFVGAVVFKKMWFKISAQQHAT